MLKDKDSSEEKLKSCLDWLLSLAPGWDLQKLALFPILLLLPDLGLASPPLRLPSCKSCPHLLSSQGQWEQVSAGPCSMWLPAGGTKMNCWSWQCGSQYFTSRGLTYCFLLCLLEEEWMGVGCARVKHMSFYIYIAPDVYEHPSKFPHLTCQADRSLH